MGNYLTKVAFLKKNTSFASSDIFQLPYLQNINSQSISGPIKRRYHNDHIMPLFMMHIWMKNYVAQILMFTLTSKIRKKHLQLCLK
jgi:asparagine synthase (glutamine-hydrolysing)